MIERHFFIFSNGIFSLILWQVLQLFNALNTLFKGEKRNCGHWKLGIIEELSQEGMLFVRGARLRSLT